MRLLHYVDIENFKTFGVKQRIELAHPSVIIGPNNCGKTSVIQALALWSQAVKTWHRMRGASLAKERASTAINRLAIVSAPVLRTRFFWHDTRVRTGNRDVSMAITVGVEYEGVAQPLTMRFRNQGEDLVYCAPDDDARRKHGFIAHAASISVELLYPMSGIETEEPVLQAGRIEVLLGQGQTAQVLRNLCLAVQEKSADDWAEISKWMSRLFQATLETPKQNARGAIELSYRQEGTKEPLDISASGRGFQQLLLLFAYLYSHKNSVLLIDEPDAHLEILRQKQIFVLLREIAALNGSQVIIVTHSEVVLDEALETNLTLILEGRTDNIAKKTDTRQSLRVYGADHYLRARERGYVLYVEGSTDADFLRALSEKAKHPVCAVWDERINTFYTRNTHPESTTESELERAESGYGVEPKERFFGLRKLHSDLKGLAILDNDNRSRTDSDSEGLRISYWKRYEVENYVITPELLLAYVAKRRASDMFVADDATTRTVLDEIVRERVFAGNARNFDTWRMSPPDAARLVWETTTQFIKLSAFAEEFFRRLAQTSGYPMLLTKGELHRLVDEMPPDAIHDDVAAMLDALKELFEEARPLVEAATSGGVER